MMLASKLVAKAVLINEAGRILIVRRSKTDPISPGELDIPGGGVEEDENYETAVQREIKEETGLDIPLHDLHLVFTKTVYFDHKSTIRFLYAASLKSTPEITLSHEHDAYDWMRFEEVKTLYDHPVWVEGMQYAAQHGLMPAEIA